jgi:hypothetical protein
MAFQAGQSGHLDEHNKWHQFLDDVKDPNKRGQYPGIEGPPGLDGPIGPAGPGAEYQPDAPTQRKDSTPLESGDIWVDSDDVMFAYELIATGTAPANPLDGQLWFNTGTNILHRFEAASNNWVRWVCRRVRSARRDRLDLKESKGRRATLQVSPDLRATGVMLGQRERKVRRVTLPRFLGRRVRRVIGESRGRLARSRRMPPRPFRKSILAPPLP